MKPAPSISLINLTDAEARIVGSLESALTETGFVMVQGHGIPSELVRDVRRVVEGYFSRPAEEKMLDCITPDNYRGYIPLGFFSPNTGATHLTNTRDTSSITKPLKNTLFGSNVIYTAPINGRQSQRTCLRSLPNFGGPVTQLEDTY